MEHRKVDARQMTGRASSGDDAERFLRELRQLRHGAGLGHAELAARAHYPYDFIMAAEAGPALPDLPVLSAYVRGCGGTPDEWEERWRTLTSTPSLKQLPTRSAGCSAAASAGARVGSATAVPDGPDPATVLKALDRVAAEMATALRSARAATESATAGSQAACGHTAQAAQAAQVTAPRQAADWAAATPDPPTPDTVTAAAPAAAEHLPGTKTATSPGTSPDTGPGTRTASGAASPTAAPRSPVAAAEPRVVIGFLSSAPSRGAILVLIAIVTCVIIALLTLFA